MAKTCLDLFSGLGGFSAAFDDADGWDVVTVDLNGGFDPDIQADVLELMPPDLPDPDFVLASPPCNCFTVANGDYHFKDGKIQTERARDSIVLVHHTIGIIKALEPDYWVLENPRGFLRRFIGPPVATVTYCQYGLDYMKPTDLWGDHPPGMDYRSCDVSDDCHFRRIGEEDSGAPTTAAERAKVPYELSKSILDAVEGRGEQSTLTTAVS